MMIVDAIRSASTEHAVYFLVTAYVESLRHFERANGVPCETLELPVAGSDDLARRLTSIEAHQAHRVDSIVPMSELAAVLACAIARLDELAAQPDSRLMQRARSDSPHSALSV